MSLNLIAKCDINYPRDAVDILVHNITRLNMILKCDKAVSVSSINVILGVQRDDLKLYQCYNNDETANRSMNPKPVCDRNLLGHFKRAHLSKIYLAITLLG